MSFLDFTQYYKGQDAADAANWRDQINELNQRKGEEALRQSQATYDLGLPIAQEQATGVYGDIVGKQTAAENIANIMKDMSATRGVAGVNPALEHETLTRRLQDLYANTGGTGQVAERRAYDDFVAHRASQLAQQGRGAEAVSLLNLLPASGAASQMKGYLDWTDPRTAANPKMVEAAGGSLSPDGKTVTYAGVAMPKERFGQFMAGQQANRMSNPTAGFANLAQVNALVNANQQLAPGYAAHDRVLMSDPFTGTPIVGYAPPAAPVAPVVVPTTLPATGIPTSQEWANPTGYVTPGAAAPTAVSTAPSAGVPAASVPAASVPAASVPAASVPAANSNFAASLAKMFPSGVPVAVLLQMLQHTTPSAPAIGMPAVDAMGNPLGFQNLFPPAAAPQALAPIPNLMTNLAPAPQPPIYTQPTWLTGDAR